MSLKIVRRAASIVLIAAAAMAVTAQSVPAKSGAPNISHHLPKHLKFVAKYAVFICNIGRRPNVLVLRNHNAVTIPKNTKIYFVASNSKLVASGHRTLNRSLATNSTYLIRFRMASVVRNGKPKGCRAYAKWYVISK